jgi:hypothetical protein
MRGKSKKIKASSWYLKHSAFWVAFSVALAWYGLSGCAYNREFHEVFVIDSIAIHAVSDRSLFDYSEAQKASGGWAGYAKYPQNEIWILSKKDLSGKIWFDHVTLGHELAHILNWKYPAEIANPDNIFH